MGDEGVVANVSTYEYHMVNAENAQNTSRERRREKRQMFSDVRMISKIDWITVGVLYMVFAPIFGYLGDRYNRKVIMSSGVFLWCLTTFVGSYMKTFGWFLLFRALVGIGEASYSTIAPTIISDLFVKDVRSKMLALFYFAIPVGSGLGYITGGEVARVTGAWQWGLRITPLLGILAIILLLTAVRDPIRGEREGGVHLSNTAWSSDIKALLKNQSFMLSTGGFTCVAFVTGALGWWAPMFLQLAFALDPNGHNVDPDDVSYKFGLIGMLAGLIGVPMGSLLAQKLRVQWQQADPLICAMGLLISVPLLFFATIIANTNSVVCYILIFFGQLSLNLNWSIVADMLLYVVIPTRRSTAEAFQILIAHAFGDAGSPYLIGLLSEELKTVLSDLSMDGKVKHVTSKAEDALIEFRSLQYAMFLTMFVAVLGSLFFFLTALYIQKDKALVDLTIADGKPFLGRTRNFQRAFFARNISQFSCLAAVCRLSCKTSTTRGQPSTHFNDTSCKNKDKKVTDETEEGLKLEGETEQIPTSL
ncbi:Protein spinster [Melipona quadrifasciata]|uniref:Protein spinster n=1 Tax=Melipona quadrifasciata TaxID=166423 RepID=A0A0N0U4F0_9HYME|nr:Protein spinster [Melipona quadrifasciata]